MEETRNNWPYNDYDDLVCSICRKQTKTSDCELLEGTVLEVLEVVLIHLNLTTVQPVICNDCSKKLLEAFQHKSKWIYTEDRLFPYVNSAIDGKVDMQTVYLTENDCKRSGIRTDTQICRLCMELINDKSWNMLVDILEKQYSLEIFEKYVPELNLSATENPIICKRCLDSLRIFMGFITFYQEVKTEEFFEVKEESGGINLTLTEHMKLNKYHSKCRDIKGMKRLKVDEDMEHSCPNCSYVSNDKAHFLKHALIHKARNKAKLRNCKICSYNSSFKGNVERHMQTHKSKSLKCSTCKFRTRNEFNLRKHETLHRTTLQLKEPEMYKCALCSYHTNDKRHLRKHILIHKSLYEVEVFDCKFCSFKTKYKANIRQHILIHKPLFEVKVFKCEFCSYETKHQRSLPPHILSHKSISEVEVFKCELCSYKTKYKGNIRSHMVIHKPSSKVELFKCELCAFETKRKGCLRHHYLIHKPLSEVEVFKCKICSFETKRKKSLQRHMLIHQTRSAK